MRLQKAKGIVQSANETGPWMGSIGETTKGFI